MKKIISMILLLSMLVSMFSLTSCDKEEMALGIIKIIIDAIFPPEPEPEPEHVHTVDIIPAEPATCTSAGLSEGRYCLTCGEILVAQKVTELKPHTYDSDSDAICNICNYERYCVHHNTHKIPGKASTCTETGLTDGEVCLDCNAILVEQQIVPLVAHTVIEIPAVASTCTTHGKTAGAKCGVCGEELVSPQEAPLAAHTEGKLSAEESTCITHGKTEGKYCTVCEKVLVPQEEAPLKNHTYSNDSDLTCNVCDHKKTCDHPAASLVKITGKAATCTATGLTDGEKCGICGEIIKAQTSIAPKGHNSNTTLDAVAANCTKTGLTEGKKCSDCGTITKAQTVIAANGHNSNTTLDAVASTCTKTGLTEGKKCSVCGTITKAQTVVPLKAHTPGDWIIDKMPTLEESGKKHKECTVCKQITSQVELKWVVSNSGSFEYATFPSGFDTSNSIYKNMQKSAYTSYETDTTKRVVTTKQTGYVYWHWMYSTGAAAGDRVIYYKNDYYKYKTDMDPYLYKCFGAFKSTNDYNRTTSNRSQPTPDYYWYKVTDRTSNADTQGSYYWYRFVYYTCTYTDYVLSEQ